VEARPHTRDRHRRAINDPESARAATAELLELTPDLILAVYWAQAAANAFPGAAWTDPEFLKPGESLTEFAPQLYIDIGMSVIVIFAAWLAWPRTAEAPAPAISHALAEEEIE